MMLGLPRKEWTWTNAVDATRAEKQSAIIRVAEIGPLQETGGVGCTVDCQPGRSRKKERSERSPRQVKGENVG